MLVVHDDSNSNHFGLIKHTPWFLRLKEFNSRAHLALYELDLETDCLSCADWKWTPDWYVIYRRGHIFGHGIMGYFRKIARLSCEHNFCRHDWIPHIAFCCNLPIYDWMKALAIHYIMFNFDNMIYETHPGTVIKPLNF